MPSNRLAIANGALPGTAPVTKKGRLGKDVAAWRFSKLRDQGKWLGHKAGMLSSVQREKMLLWSGFGLRESLTVRGSGGSSCT